MRTTVTLAFIIALAHPAAGQDRLSAARDLYSSASYEEALAALTTIAASAPQEVALEAHQYRAFSLFALGRTAEAEQVAEMSIRLNPLGKVSEAETSPRIASMFTAVRKRVLPAVIRDEYRVARAAIDRKDMKAAEPHLTLASRLLTEVKSMGIADDTLSDLSLVIDGFLGLSRAVDQPQPVAKPTTQPAAGPMAATGTANAAGANPGAGGAAPAPAAAKPQVHFGPATSRLTLPVTLRQQSPELPRNVTTLMTGLAGRSLVLSVVINERGDVDDVSIVQPLLSVYDTLVARAARQWKYEPATLDGVPVKYRKVLTVNYQGQ
jgi:hypothetical protein